MVVSSEIQVVQEVKITEATIRLRSDGIVHVLFNKNVTLDIDLQLKLLNLYKEITNNAKLPFVFSAMEGVIITKEARDNAIKIESQAPVSAVAVVADTLAYKIIANFYLKFNKPKSQYKVFTKFEDAIVWLYAFKAQI